MIGDTEVVTPGRGMMDLKQAMNQFERHASEGRRLSPLTVAAYTSDVRQFISWCEEQGIGLEVEDVTASVIEEWAASRADVSPSTLQRNLASLSSMFSFLEKRELVFRNPVALVDRPRCPESQPVCLNDDHLQRLLEVVEDRQERALLLTMALLGLRRSEVLKLNLGDVDFATARVHIHNSKGGKSRVLPIPSELRPVLQEHLAGGHRSGEEPLFLSKHGRRLSRSALARLFAGWLAAADLADRGLTPHSCRHGAATRWLKAGLNIRDVQLLLGHGDIGITARYLHVTIDDLAEELEAKVSLVAEERRDSQPTGSREDRDGWENLLSRLSSDQREALMAVAQSMVTSEAGQ